MFQTTTSTPTLSSSTQAFTVSELNTMVSDVLSAGLPSFLWIEGEISNLSLAASGHRYLSLKDAGATVSCALFKGSSLKISREILGHLKNGDKVVVKASLSVYKPRGNYQLIISDIEPAGFGALAKAFALLKSKLENEGLMATEFKKPLPSWPKRIGIITSESGAAIRDVLTTLGRRAPFIDLSVYPAMVQGEHAADQIMSALQQANQPVEDNELILLVRGGGSLEDLQAFNNESLAYAVFNSRLPVITGVGHETDFTIVDFVSDCRAPTPTAAAEVASPDKIELAKQLNHHTNRLRHSMVSSAQRARKELNFVSQRLATQHPEKQLQQQNQRLDELSLRLQRLVIQDFQRQQLRLKQYHRQLKSKAPTHQVEQWALKLEAKKQSLLAVTNLALTERQLSLDILHRRLQKSATRFKGERQRLLGVEARLKLLSPLGILDRGYALVFDELGQLVKETKAIKAGSSLSIQLADGVIEASVKKPC